jgi:hypothetical protein
MPLVEKTSRNVTNRNMVLWNISIFRKEFKRQAVIVVPEIERKKGGEQGGRREEDRCRLEGKENAFFNTLSSKDP